MIDETLRTRIEAWQALDPDPGTRDELDRLVAEAERPGGADAEAELQDRFAGPLAFGTSGVRGPLGAGPRRMNRVVVEQLAAGLMRWLPGRVGAGDRPVTIVVGRDARHRSEDLALDIARVVAAAGGIARVLPGPVPTPVLAFAVRHLGADAGIMCTASHNPPADNGVKVYLDDGAQIVAPDDDALAAAVAEVAATGEPVVLGPADHPGIERLDRSVEEAYLAHVTRVLGGLGVTAPPTGDDLPIVYSPLHGVAGGPAVRLLRASGFTAVDTVAAQARPDPDFPTTPYPDPEEPGAYELALGAATEGGAALVLLNDPDGDRLGVAAPGPGGAWRILNGNEIGALLCEHLLSCTEGDDRLVVTTYVSSRLLPAIARHHGVHHIEVPTGFKWVIRPALAHPELRFVLGFEESLGFSVDAGIREKDGLAAAVAFAGMVAAQRAAGESPDDVLERLSRRHGHHASLTWSARLGGPGAPGRLRAVVDAWRRSPPTKLAGRRVLSSRDLAAGRAGFPPLDAVVLDCEGDARVVLRPSGTEPKMKVHLEVVEPVPPGPAGYAQAQRAAGAAVEDLRAAVAADLGLGEHARM